MVDESFTVVIPARYASTRLPAKPLIDLHGKPMIQRVAERALDSDAKMVIVATDDVRVANAVQSNEVRVVLTGGDHQSGTDRVWEVVSNLDLGPDEIIVNVQGDEPLIPPDLINQAARLLTGNSNFGVGTLCEPIHDIQVVLNPNVVKVVRSKSGQALYFSRAPIPWERGRFGTSEESSGEVGDWYRHLGIYSYRRSVLARFVNLPVSSLEKLESLEQLRLLENDIPIQIAESLVTMPGGVDTPADVEKVRRHLENCES